MDTLWLSAELVFHDTPFDEKYRVVLSTCLFSPHYLILNRENTTDNFLWENHILFCCVDMLARHRLQSTSPRVSSTWTSHACLLLSELIGLLHSVIRGMLLRRAAVSYCGAVEIKLEADLLVPWFQRLKRTPQIHKSRGYWQRLWLSGMETYVAY